MRRKIIFLDLDGTLLSSDKTVSEENMRVLKQALLNGHLVAITTGRSTCGGKRIMREIHLDLPGCYLLSFQGSEIYDWGRNEILFSDGIDGETAAELLEAFDREGIHAHTFVRDGILTLHESPQLLRYNQVAKEKYTVLDNLEQLRGRICSKVIAVDYDDHQKLERFREMFSQREKGRLNSFFSSRALLEYCKAGINKGNALKRLAQMLDIPTADTIAVGDEENDISMIKAAGTGIAMQNAYAAVKQAADYVTENDCDHSGVAEAVKKFVLQ